MNYSAITSRLWGLKRIVGPSTALVVASSVLTSGGFGALQQSVSVNSGTFKAGDELQQTMLRVRDPTNGVWMKNMPLQFNDAGTVYAGWAVAHAFDLRAVKAEEPDPSMPEPAPKAVTRASLRITQIGEEKTLNDKIRLDIFLPRCVSSQRCGIQRHVSGTLTQLLNVYGRDGGADIGPIYIANNVDSRTNLDQTEGQASVFAFVNDHVREGAESSPLKIELTPTELEKN